MQSKRAAALEMTNTAGRVSMLSAEKKASYFDCDIADVSDQLENLCQNAYALCAAAEVTDEESATAYSNGQVK